MVGDHPVARQPEELDEAASERLAVGGDLIEETKQPRQVLRDVPREPCVHGLVCTEERGAFADAIEASRKSHEELECLFRVEHMQPFRC